MKARKSKLKLSSKNKSYPLNQSPLYKITSKHRLASVLGVEVSELKQLGKDKGNYSVFAISDAKGSPRQIQKPIGVLEKIHSRLASYLIRIEAPNFLHSGIKGRCTYTNVSSHKGDVPLLTTDLKSFFPSTSRRKVFDFFLHSMKCESDVADILSKISTFNSHIPTGSQLSMPLAYWANSYMFCELHDYARRKGIEMSVYVDDLTFSGKLVNQKFLHRVRNIVEQNGHVLHPNKTKTRLYSAKQTKIVTGVALNNSGIKVSNKHHLSIHRDIAAIKEGKADAKTKNRLIGKLNAFTKIEPGFRDKARSARLLTTD